MTKKFVFLAPGFFGFDSVGAMIACSQLPEVKAIVKFLQRMGGTLAQPHDDCDALLHRVDEALYAAKAAGRNALRLAEEPT